MFAALIPRSKDAIVNFLFGKNCQIAKMKNMVLTYKWGFHVRNGTNSSEVEEMKFQIAILL